MKAWKLERRLQGPATKKLREYTPDQADIIATTLSNAGVAWPQGSIHPGVIAVDEATKATEPDI